MSAATMGRIYRRHPLSGPRHHAPGNVSPLKNAIPACPGKAIEDGRPGVCQFDSVMHGGGLPEPCFHTEHLTDAETQWDELSAAWNRGPAIRTTTAGSNRRTGPSAVRGSGTRGSTIRGSGTT